jgi:hypothetical protein
MNGLDDDDINARLTSLFHEEPPMASLAVEDLARGRQLLRRRRRTAFVATATALPAVLVGGWAVGTATLGSSGSATSLQPADGGEPSDAGNDDTVTVCWVGSATLAPDDGGTTESGEPGDSAPQTVDPTPTDPQQCEAVPWVADDCSAATLDLSDPDATLTPPDTHLNEVSPAGPGNGTLQSAPDAHSDAGGSTSLRKGYTLTVGPGEAGTLGFMCDALGTVLQQHADPNDAHSATMASGTAEATTGDGPQEQSASIGWADGDREGQVTLSLSPTSATADCDDPNLESGPTVTCERRTLDDGTVVWVGHGAQDGSARVTVAYDRPDGTTVWATADEATDAWWGGDRRTDPLTAPPMTADDLIAMALDKAIK